MSALDKPVNKAPLDVRLDGEVPLEPSRKEDIIVATGEDLETDEAKDRVINFRPDALSDIINQGRQVGMDPSQLLEQVDQIAQKKQDFYENKKFVLEQALSVNDDKISAIEARFNTNLQIAREMIKDKARGAIEDRTLLGYTVDAFDRFILRQIPIGTVEDLTARTERMGKKILDLMYLPTQEMTKEFDLLIRESLDEGVLVGNNYFAVQALIEELESFGFDPEKENKQLLSAVEALSLGNAPITSLGRVARKLGPNAAGKAGNQLLKLDAPDAQVISELGPRPFDLNSSQTTRASSHPFVSSFNSNDIIKKFELLSRKGAFGKVADESQISQFAREAAERYAKDSIAPLYDYEPVYEGLGNYTVKIRLGKSENGEPFKMSTIRNLADRIENARMVPIDPKDEGKGFVVEITERLDLSDLHKELDIGLMSRFNFENNVSGRIANFVTATMGKFFDNDILGSAALRDVDYLSTLSQRAESGRAAVKDILKPYVSKLNKLGPKSRFTLNAVYTQLRDGKDAHLRVRYTDAEFAVEFKRLHPDGKEATSKDIEAYRAIATIEEADYLLKTSNMMQRYIKNGYDSSVEIFNGVFIPAKRVSKGEAEDIFDVGSGEFVGATDLPDDIPVWRLDRVHPDGHKFITNPISKRIIEQTDVMGYNPGGTRLNPKGRFIVVVGETKGRLKALMTAFTEGQAKAARLQIERIRNAIRDGESNIDEVIRQNNDWNPDIESIQDWNRLVQKEGWDLSGDINYKPRDQKIILGEVENPDVFAGMSVDDYIQNDMRRRDQVLMHFGGGKTYNEGPINSIMAQFGNSVYTYSNKAYTQYAMASWVKLVQKRGDPQNWLRKDVSPSDYETLFVNANVTGSDEFSRRMKELQQITFRRLGMKDESYEYMSRLGRSIEEYVFDTFGKEVVIPDVTRILMDAAFQSAFGLVNLSQFVMQGLHVATITAISPVHGFKAAYLVPTIRNMLRLNDPEAYKLAVKRLSKTTDISESDIEELFEYIRTSGRHIVDGDAAEDGTGIGFNLSGFNGEDMSYNALSGKFNSIVKLSKKGLDMGLMPFKAGERLSRLTSMTTAFLEWKARNPRASALSEEARNFITRRDQDLTFNMNTLSRSKFQSGVMKAPTQWLSFSMRAFEAVFVGRNFTPGERLRLFGILAPMYGLTGFGFGNSASYVAEKIGIKPDSSWYVALKSGMIDGLADWVGAPVSVGSRLAPVGAVKDVWDKIFEDSTIEALGGPSVEIVGGGVRALFEALGSLATGSDVSFTEDMMRVIRTPSAIDNMAKAVGIYNYGVYQSKSGKVAITSRDNPMGVEEMIVTLFGFTPAQVEAGREAQMKKGKYNGDLSAFRKEVNREADVALGMVRSEDPKRRDRGIEMLREINAKIALSPFSYADQMSLRRSVLKAGGQSYEELVYFFYKIGDNYTAEMLRSRLGEEEPN